MDNARLLADVWSYMERSSNRITIDVRSTSRLDGDSLLLTLAQRRYGEDVHRTFDATHDSREVFHLCGVEKVCLDNTDGYELLVETKDVSISFKVRDR